MRLTKDEGDGYYSGDCCQICECSDKLGKLEDLEDKIGIELLPLFKALNNKIYTRLGTEHYIGFDLIEQDSKGDYLFNLIDGNYYFKDYGKTWALTREELL